jgi:hypothetical protein
LDKSTKYDISRTHRRLNDVEVSTDFRLKAEGIALAHLAAGNISEFQASMNVMGKTTAQQDISDKLDTLGTAIASLASKVS